MGCGKKGEPTPKAEPESTSRAKPSRLKQTPSAGSKEEANPWENPTSLSLFMTREYAGEGQVNALVEIARAQIGAGNKQEAVKTLRQAWVVAQTIKDAPDPDDGPDNPKGGSGSESSSRALMMIAMTLTAAGDPKQALEVIQTIKNEHAKSEVRLHIALVLSERGDLKQALEVAQTINDASRKAYALRAIVQFLSEKGDLKQALEVARMIKDGKIRADHVRSIFSALIEAGEIKQALEVARTIKNVRSKANALKEIALAQIKTGDKQQSLATLKQALEVIQTVKDERAKSDAQVLIALVLSERGDSKQAMEVAQTIKDARSKVRALREIALFQIKAGDKQQSLVTLKQALEVIRTFKYAGGLIDVVAPAPVPEKFEDIDRIDLNDIKSALSNEPGKPPGTTTKAVDLSDIAPTLVTTITRTIKGDRLKAEALIEIARFLAEAGDRQQALNTFKQATKVTRLIKIKNRMLLDVVVPAPGDKEAQRDTEVIVGDDSMVGNLSPFFFRRDALLRSIVSDLAGEGHIKEALELARSFKDDKYKAEALIDIARFLAKAGDKQQALATFKQAAEAARLIKDRKIYELRAPGDKEAPKVTYSSIPRMGVLRSIISDLAGEKHIEEALELARSFKDDNARTDALSSVAGTLAEAGDYKRALGLARSFKVDAKVAALMNIAQVQIGAKEWQLFSGILKETLVTAEAIKSDENKANVLQSILIRAGDAQHFPGGKGQDLVPLQQGLKLARTIKDEGFKHKALMIILQLMDREDGQKTPEILRQALEVAQTIKVEQPPNGALVENNRIPIGRPLPDWLRLQHLKRDLMEDIARSLANVGDFKKALEVAHMSRDGRNKVDIHMYIDAWAYGAFTGKRHDLVTLEQVWESARTIELPGGVDERFERTYDQTEILRIIALALATEPAPDRKNNPVYPGSAVRMKKAFTAEEKQFAKLLVEAVQEKQ